MVDGTPGSWWLIHKDTAEVVRGALAAAIVHIDGDCARKGCECHKGTVRCSAHYANALHELDSGLHTTDEVPADWKQR